MNFARSLPNSLPVPESRSVVVQEDGEVGDHTADPAFYQRPIPSSELVFISLRASDFDENPDSPNYRPQAKKETLKPVKILQMTPLDVDSSGRFYFANGTEIDRSVIPVVIYPENVTNGTAGPTRYAYMHI